MRFERSFNFCGGTSKWLTTRPSPRKRLFAESVAPVPVERWGRSRTHLEGRLYAGVEYAETVAVELA